MISELCEPAASAGGTRPRFIGWRMVAIGALTCFVSAGFVFYSYGVFFKAIMAELGGSRLAVSTGFTAMNLAIALASPIVGRVLDRRGARRVMTVGALLLGLGFGVASRVSMLWQFQLVFGTLIGIAVCMLGPLGTSSLIANWFVARRGSALAYATMGISAAGVLLPLCLTHIISTYGWRVAFLTCAAFVTLLVLPLVHFGVVSRPEEIGALPDGAPARHDRPTPATAPPPAFDTWQAVRTRNFIAITLVIGLNACCMQGIGAHLVPFLTDRRWSAGDAALGLSLMAAVALLARPLFGLVADRIALRWVVILAVGLEATGLVAVLCATSVPMTLAGLGVYATGMACLVPLQGALIGAAFGRQVFGRVMGIMSPAMFPIVNIGVLLAGWLHDREGDYQLAFEIFLGLYALSIAAMGLFCFPVPPASPSTRPLARPGLEERV